MKKFHVLIWVFMSMGLISFCYGQDTTNQTTGSMSGSSMSAARMSSEILDRDKEIEKVVESDNKDQLGNFLADDYHSIDAHGIRSKDEQVQFMKNMETRSVQKSDEKVTFPTNDVAILTYKAKYDRGTTGGEDMSGIYNASSTFVKRNGQWLVIQRVMVKAGE